MTEFTPLASLLGGAIIGLAAILLMDFHGRIAGMTGILSGLLPPLSNDWAWRAAFIAGAIVAPALIIVVARASALPFESPVPTPWLIIGGFIVGIGVHFGGGCTSGHGVCGLARLSPRSIAATLIFMASTALTVFAVRHLLGGF
jgi:uncharacterized membrane protein YedE/YeeE